MGTICQGEQEYELHVVHKTKVFYCEVQVSWILLCSKSFTERAKRASNKSGCRTLPVDMASFIYMLISGIYASKSSAIISWTNLRYAKKMLDFNFRIHSAALRLDCATQIALSQSIWEYTAGCKLEISVVSPEGGTRKKFWLFRICLFMIGMIQRHMSTFDWMRCGKRFQQVWILIVAFDSST